MWVKGWRDWPPEGTEVKLTVGNLVGACVLPFVILAAGMVIVSIAIEAARPSAARWDQLSFILGNNETPVSATA